VLRVPIGAPVQDDDGMASCIWKACPITPVFTALRHWTLKRKRPDAPGADVDGYRRLPFGDPSVS
jgi:hypothetical protein